MNSSFFENWLKNLPLQDLSPEKKYAIVYKLKYGPVILDSV